MDALIDYDAEYYRSHYSLYLDEGYHRLIAGFWQRNWFLGYDVNQDTSVFEYGLGLGANVAWSKRAGGCDASPYSQQFCAEKGIRVYKDPAEVPDGSYDFVLSSHSLEHVDHPLQVIREMTRICRPSGRVVLIVPWERHGRSTFAKDGDAHLYAWTFRTLNNLLLRGGGLELEDNRVLWGPTGVRKLQFLERLAGADSYYAAVRVLGRLRGSLRSLRVVARRV
ncbi:MAG TPA: class I SAM-dependent methyltransferase [Polyangia bacterium]|jgi:SAM-dependent methyltransferase